MNVQSRLHPSLITPALLQHDERPVKNLEAIAKPPYCQQFVYIIPEELKDLMVITLLAGKQHCNIVIYVRTNSASDSLAEKLNREGIVQSCSRKQEPANNGERSEKLQRQSHGRDCCNRKCGLLFDMKVTTVINYDLPLSAETYGKRMSRHSAARTLKMVISFCDLSEQAHLSNINSAFPDEIEMLAHNLA